jgi:hypothetical protein
MTNDECRINVVKLRTGCLHRRHVLEPGGLEAHRPAKAGTAILQANSARNGRQYDRHSCLSVLGRCVNAGSRQTGVSIVLSEKRRQIPDTRNMKRQRGRVWMTSLLGNAKSKVPSRHNKQNLRAAEMPVAGRSNHTSAARGSGGIGRGRYAASLFHRCFEDDRDDEDGEDVHHLDHRIHSRAGGILVGIAHGVSRHCGLMGKAALAAVVAFFLRQLHAVI